MRSLAVEPHSCNKTSKSLAPNMFVLYLVWKGCWPDYVYAIILLYTAKLASFYWLYIWTFFSVFYHMALGFWPVMVIEQNYALWIDK